MLADQCPQIGGILKDAKVGATAGERRVLGDGRDPQGCKSGRVSRREANLGRSEGSSRMQKWAQPQARGEFWEIGGILKDAKVGAAAGEKQILGDRRDPQGCKSGRVRRRETNFGRSEDAKVGS